MGWRDTISRWLGTPDERSSLMPYSDYLPWVNFGGHTYWLTGSLAQTLTSDREEPAKDYVGLVDWAYRTNAVVAACIDVRIKHFSEARFQFQRLRDGRPGELFGTAELGILERPWPGGTTGDLLARMMQDADFAGNAYIARIRSGRETMLTRLRPDWVTIVLGSNMEPTEPAFAVDALTIGYLYHPGGPALGREPIILRPEQVAHFAPIPDPTANYRGMSWVSAVIREISADTGMTEHKRMYVQNGATPNLVVTLKEPISPESFNEWVAKFGQRHEGAYNAYRTMYLAGGADAKVVGSDLAQVDFKSVQGAGETRIAAAAGVPPVIVGLSEGLAAATYSNYGQARRRFADGTMRPLWRNVAGSLERIVRVPAGSRLWIDDRDILFLQEDMKDRADIQAVQAQAIRSLVDAGFVPETVVAAVQADDFGQLKHSQLYSVQLRPPGNENEIVPNSEPIAPQNGNGAQGDPNRPPSRRELLDHLLARVTDEELDQLRDLGAVLRHKPGGHDHDQSTHGNWAEGTASDLPDLPVDAGFAGLPPEARELILRYAEDGFGEDFPATPEEMASILDALYDRATPEQVRDGLDWYDTANRLARRYADEYLDGDFDTACAIIARTSPGREWESNIELARRIMAVQTGNAEFAIDAEVYESLRDKSGIDGPGTYRPGDLTPEQLAWAHPEFRDESLGKTYEHVPQIADALRLARGEMTPDEALGGPKIRNFYNNIHDPEDPRFVTIDTWQVRGSLPADGVIKVKTRDGFKSLATRAKSTVHKKAVDVTVFTGKPSLTRKGQPILKSGMYSMFAEAVKIAAARRGVLPNEYQAITWIVLRREDT